MRPYESIVEEEVTPPPAIDKAAVYEAMVRRLDPRTQDLARRAHRTHKLSTYRGVVWCRKCGCHGTYIGTRKAHLKHLGAQCEPPGRLGAINLKRLARDPRKPPQGMDAWPDTLARDAANAARSGPWDANNA